jgi:MuDR family transposase
LLSDEDNTEEDESIDLVLSEDLSVEEDEGAVQSNLMIGECSLNDVLSEYENSDDEIAIPTVVNNKTDFRRFKWCVGIVFGNHLEFRQAVTRYAIAQGRNLKICASDKKRLQRLGVRCVAGCPFRIFASWDRKIASYVVKSVDGNHTCQRNMDSNIQFKASWCADELLDLFKSRPHIPSSEIVDIVRKNYRIIITRGFA